VAVLSRPRGEHLKGFKRVKAMSFPLRFVPEGLLAYGEVAVEKARKRESV